MQILTLYIASAIAFLALDSVMLTQVIQPLFQRHLGEMLRSPIDMGAATLFYLMYIAGIVWFVGWPALKEGSVSQALVQGALLGAFAYGTYELTSKAVMRDWSWTMVATDWAWGTVLTGLTAAIGVWVARSLTA
ncbi:DUF2177 family protein [Jannaschia aquimarina]|uniref:DUF2177 domain-containing protein n=1 Tax=Jannaschia aquimarina TaxID=935700 RepID=A0A0D1EHY4_9RHOB|nr:DUF2177 family protein [Jannaschia aquimarina]KIT15450.1 hypothetical protein jaqu_28840 [Jannaschia aquimarina]SNT22206.1 Uncharacterized membrane protein [Jannaschia aquimarina]